MIGRPNTTANNLIMGNMYLEHVGPMTVHNYTNGMHAVATFEAESYFNKNKHRVSGSVWPKKDADKEEALASFEGTWSKKLTFTQGNQVDQPLWQATPNSDDYDWQYFMTDFAKNLNACPEELKAVLPRSDSRLRPDLRALENQELELAASEKHRLEEKQRAARKFREENPGNDFEPKYFRKIMDEDTKEEYYAYGPAHGKRDYWQDRAK